MAESEQSDRNTWTPPRRSYHQNRPSSSYRGRGRANASVSKALHLFGVRDLREILDRKHQEQDETSSGPPPDPSYSYLKDPSRENTNGHQNQKYQKEQHPEKTSSDQYQRSYHFRGSRGRGRDAPRDNRHSESEKAAFLQNPVNIKVELVASTGERNCKIDKETKLADIKHVPNYKLKDLRIPRNENRDGNDWNRNERGRGRGQRGGRGDRGRGRGRGQNRYPSNKNDSTQEGGRFRVQNTPEVDSEENWDTSLNDPPAENMKSNEEETVDEGSHDGDNEDQVLEQEEQYYDEADVEDYEEGASQNSGILEENFIISSSAEEDKNKRMVTFKLDDEAGAQETQTPKSKDGEVVEPLKKEDTEKVEASKDEK